jgi:hypothetical protein
MGDLRLARQRIEGSLERLDAARHLKLLPGTHRVLMAFPFSGIATPYRVTVNGTRSYFANCAWDAVAFSPLLEQPIQVESFCHHCGQPLSFQIRGGKVQTKVAEAPVVYLGRPAGEWWTDIITTCSNTMMFFRSTGHLSDWRQAHPEAGGVELSIEVVLRLSGPLYSGKMTSGFARPSRDRLVQLFQELNLTGEFWKV